LVLKYGFGHLCVFRIIRDILSEIVVPQ
jgi:hypothetical protein